MKTFPLRARRIVLATLATIGYLTLMACAPPSGTNNTNSPGNANTTVTPAATATPSPTPVCDDRAVNEQLIAAFTDPRNGYGPDGFDKIKKTVNFYSKNCEVHLWGYTKNVGTFKKLLRVTGNVRTSTTASVPDFENLYIDRNEYPHLPGAGGCSSPYKACGDICIPEEDSCWSEIAFSKSN
jgi:hypothetical protein